VVEQQVVGSEVECGERLIAHRVLVVSLWIVNGQVADKDPMLCFTRLQDQATDSSTRYGGDFDDHGVGSRLEAPTDGVGQRLA
jgi:hypothetical protein